MEKMTPAELHLVDMKPIAVPPTQLDRIAEPLRKIAEAVEAESSGVSWEIKRGLIVELALTFIKIKWLPTPITRFVLGQILDIIYRTLK